MIDVDAVCRLLVEDLDGWEETIGAGYEREFFIDHELFRVSVTQRGVYVDSLPVGYFDRRAVLRALGARRARLVSRHLARQRIETDPELKEAFAEVRRLVG